MKILTVDDDEIGLDLLNQSLTEAGYDVVSATNGREALDLLETESIWMVITDWEMPEMNGLQLCEAIRSFQAGGYVYVIILTAHDDSEAVVKGLSVGADDFITKPYNTTELCLRVRAGARILAVETRNAAIFAMAKLVESRDPRTGGHLERIQYYCLVLAEWLARHGALPYRKDRDYRRMIYLTSALHDIGKIGVPDAVLLKPSDYSEREFELMKRHTTFGAEALESALAKSPDAAFLRMGKDIAATHHERFDGSGYPRGLRGDEIPLCGRIVALADVYDALTSTRVYKEALPHEIAKSMIEQEAGSHFDPEVVRAFLANEDIFRDMAERFVDEAAVEGLRGLYPCFSGPSQKGSLRPGMNP